MPLPMDGRRSTATVLALAYAAMVTYASLYPFEGWRPPVGDWKRAADWIELLRLPWLPWGDPFDTWANLLGYLPFGLLLAIGRLRSGARPAVALWTGLLVPAVMSYALELTQSVLPTRHPSAKDWITNAGGAAIGAVLALGLHHSRLVDRWHGLRQRWFESGSEPALALLALWPLGLLFPAPVPFGLGQIAGGGLLEALSAWVDGSPLADTVKGTFAPSPARGATTAAAAPAGLSPLAEVLIITLGLLAPCVLAFVIVAPGWRRLALAFGALMLAAAGMTLSTLLNFGPRHALAWITPWTGPAVGLATVVALALAPIGRAKVIGAGLIVLTGLVIGVAHAPSDPYFAQNLQAWEQGRFVRFHGLAQWVGWLWPYAAIGWMLSRLHGRP